MTVAISALGNRHDNYRKPRKYLNDFFFCISLLFLFVPAKNVLIMSEMM